MHIAFASEYDPVDVRNWSGLPTFVARALEGAGAAVEYLGPLHRAPAPVSRARQVAARAVGGRHLLDREPRVLRGYARQLERKVRDSNPDVVVAVSTLPVAYLECSPPIVFWTDATFASLIDFYPEFSNVTAASVRRGHLAERLALARAGLAIYASEWAARSAREDYSVPDEKLRVVNFGANMRELPTSGEVGTLIATRAARLRESCQLLFVGFDWVRKGGPIAVAVARDLNERGVPTELTVVGRVPEEDPLPFVNVEGPIDKADPAGERKLAELYRKAHFLVLPTTAEAAGVVFAEASAFGVPSLAPDIGGVRDMVGAGGLVLPARAPASEYAEAIALSVSDRSRYERMAAAALSYSRGRVNWTVAGRTVMSHLAEIAA